MENEAQKQVYDNVLKRLIEGQFEQVIPLLFPALEPRQIQELTIEVLLPPRRVDKAYLITSPRGRFILHLEIEVSPRSRGQISRRMLVYHALLFEKHNEHDEGIPIITCVLYPFRMPGGEPLILEEFEDEELLRFKHRELLLSTLDAHLFTTAHAVPLYGLLPAMEGISEEILLAAIEDMIKFYGKDEEHLRDELLCFMVLLQRARPLPPIELEQVLRRIRMFDPLLEEDPWVQEYGGRREAAGEARGEARGKAEGLRQSIEIAVQTRFPDLAELAMERAERIQSLDALQKLLMAMLAAQDERRARRYLQAWQDMLETDQDEPIEDEVTPE